MTFGDNQSKVTLLEFPGLSGGQASSFGLYTGLGSCFLPSGNFSVNPARVLTPAPPSPPPASFSCPLNSVV